MDESASSVKVHLVRHENGVTICTVFPGEKVCRAMGDTGPGARVNFVVRVPEGVNFFGSTVNGGVEADSLKSDVQAYTVNGQVRVSTTGTLQAKTVNGSITASLLKPFWSKAPELSTVNGANSTGASSDRECGSAGGHQERKDPDGLQC